MNRTPYILLSLVLFLIGAGVLSCKKETTASNSSNPNVLPPLTHEGKNTFGCLVNGEVWVAYAPFTVGGTVSMNGAYHADIGGFHLTANRKNDSQNESTQIDLVILDLFQNGEYTLHDAEGQQKGFQDYLENYNCAKYYFRDNLLRKIRITYFSVSEGIISGTFEMDLVSHPACSPDTIKIREGRFDWRMTVH